MQLYYYQVYSQLFALSKRLIPFQIYSTRLNRLLSLLIALQLTIPMFLYYSILEVRYKVSNSYKVNSYIYSSLVKLLKKVLRDSYQLSKLALFSFRLLILKSKLVFTSFKKVSRLSSIILKLLLLNSKDKRGSIQL